MKVLIWFLTFFLGTAINTIIGYATGIKAGAVLLYLVEYYVGKKLCEKWDEHKLVKKAKSDYMTQKSQDYFEQRSTQVSEEPLEKKNKCPFCGEELLEESEFCSNCGKRVMAGETAENEAAKSQDRDDKKSICEPLVNNTEMGMRILSFGDSTEKQTDKVNAEPVWEAENEPKESKRIVAEEIEKKEVGVASESPKLNSEGISYQPVYTTNTVVVKRNKGLIVAVIILAVLFTISGVATAIMYGETDNYQQTINSLNNEKSGLNTKISQLEKDLSAAQSDLSTAQKSLSTAESSRDSYKKKYDDLTTTYNKNKTDNSTYNSLTSAMSKVNISDSYGSFPGKVLAVKKGETITVELSYSYSGTITAWTNQDAMKFTWLDTYTYGEPRFTLKGLKTGVYTIRVTSNNEKDAGGITTVVWIYE